MNLPIEQDIEIIQGVTWAYALRWFTETFVHKPISAVAIGLPTMVTATGHGLTGTGTAQQPVWITNVQGPRALNTDGYQCAKPRWATVVDPDTLSIEFDSGSLSAYTSGGTLSYRTSVDLTGWTAALSLYAALGDPTPLLVLDNGSNGGITLDALGNITLTVTAEQSAALALMNGWYKLELTDTAGAVTRPLEGGCAVVQAGAD